MWTSYLGLVVLIALAAVLFWPRSDFVISVRNGQVNFKGKIPRAQHGPIARFMLQDVAPQKPVRILGTWRGKRLELRFRGPLSDGDRQRVRNFLLNEGR